VSLRIKNPKQQLHSPVVRMVPDTGSGFSNSKNSPECGDSTKSKKTEVGVSLAVNQSKGSKLVKRNHIPITPDSTVSSDGPVEPVID
jgi:hypothetical protein